MNTEMAQTWEEEKLPPLVYLALIFERTVADLLASSKTLNHGLNKTFLEDFKGEIHRLSKSSRKYKVEGKS